MAHQDEQVSGCPLGVRSVAPALITAAAAIVALTPIGAQQPKPTYKRDLAPALVKQAKVSEDRAARVALGRIPGGRIQAVELEKEGGRLIYSYELKVAGKPGIEEVNVNAKTGDVVNVEHESPAAEQKESKAEKKKG